MSKQVYCDSCGGAILNPKSIIRLEDVTLCLSCYESERQSTPIFGFDIEDGFVEDRQ